MKNAILLVLILLLAYISPLAIAVSLYFAFPAYAQMSSAATKLPDELRATQIKNLEIGQYGFSVPKAMVVDEYGDCYLLGWAEVNMERGFRIKIERKVDGYYVFVRKGSDAKWVRESIMFRADKLRDKDLIPVKMVTVTR